MQFSAGKGEGTGNMKKMRGFSNVWLSVVCVFFVVLPRFVSSRKTVRRMIPCACFGSRKSAFFSPKRLPFVPFAFLRTSPFVFRSILLRGARDGPLQDNG